MKRYKLLITLLSVLCFSQVYFAQKDTSSIALTDSGFVRVQVFEEFQYDKDYDKQYAYYLRKVRKVYPLALHLKEVLDSLDNALADENKSRKQRKLVKKTHKDLKSDFKFLLKDLYRSDGRVLTKLIYRETGLTVHDIIETYKSAPQAATFTALAKAWDQDLTNTYDPTGEDYILERAVEDVNAGLERFDPEIEKITKKEYKKSKKEYRKKRRAIRKKNRKRKKKAKKKGAD